MMQRHEFLLREIASSGTLIVARSAGQTQASYLANDVLRAIVERKVEIIGEDLIRLRDADPSLFRRIAGGDEAISLRNLIAYEDEDYPRERLWQDTVRLLPSLLASVTLLLTMAGERNS